MSDEPNLFLLVRRWDEIYPGDDTFAKNPHWTLKSTGKDFYETIALLRSIGREGSLRLHLAVIIPMMHQCIELLSKALLAETRPGVNVRQYSHRTVRLMRDNTATVPLFDDLLGDEKTRELIEQLEKAYTHLRYGEAHYQFDFKEFDLFDSIVTKILAGFANQA